MKIDVYLTPVVKEIKSGADTDPDWDVKEQIKRAIDKYALNKEEIQYLCRKFGVLTEDL